MINRRNVFSALAFAIGLSILGPDAGAQVSGGDVLTLGSLRTLPNGPARLTFKDEFEGPALNRAIWTTNYTNVIPSLPNELQIYTPDTFDVVDGRLRIRTDNRSVNGYRFTSGAMTTFGSFVQRYGYFEAKVRLPTGKGLWPAFWLLPEDKSWPPEIDVMEFLGRDTSTVYQALHWTDSSGKKRADGSGFKGTDWTLEDHVFAVDWRPGKLVWLVDGREVFTVTGEQVPSVPMFMLLNTAVGGDWAGPPDATTPMPSHFEVDYVRVWQYDSIPPAPLRAVRYLTTQADKPVVKRGEKITFSFGIETSTQQPPLILQTVLVDVTGKKEVARSDFKIEASAPGRIARTWTLEIPKSVAPGLYTMSLGIFEQNWKQIDWLTNGRAILVE